MTDQVQWCEHRGEHRALQAPLPADDLGRRIKGESWLENWRRGKWSSLRVEFGFRLWRI